MERSLRLELHQNPSEYQIRVVRNAHSKYLIGWQVFNKDSGKATGKPLESYEAAQAECRRLNR